MPQRVKKHPEYRALVAYQILAEKDNKEMACELGISERTYVEKVKGWADFSPLEGRRLSELFGRSQEEIFLTKNVS